MPRGDGTGPQGLGPMTGRAAGYCAGYVEPGFTNPIPGRGAGGRGRGGRRGGRGRRNWFNATGVPGWVRAAQGRPAWGAGPFVPPDVPAAGYPAPPAGAWPQATQEQQLEALKAQAAHFEDALDGIRKRIDELQAQAHDATP